MGLDMYLVRKAPGNIVEPKEVMYWRKNYELHSYMYNLAIERGITHSRDEFNCQEMKLSSRDIGNIIFYSPLTHETIAKIRQSIKEGYTIYYTSNW